MSLVDFATSRRVTVVMFTIAVLLFGFVSLARLKVNLLPDLSYPTLTVRTELTGAAPLEIENLITRPWKKPSASSATCARCARCRARASPT